MTCQRCGADVEEVTQIGCCDDCHGPAIEENMQAMIEAGHLAVIGERDGEAIYDLTDEGRRFYLSQPDPERTN